MGYERKTEEKEEGGGGVGREDKQWNRERTVEERKKGIERKEKEKEKERENTEEKER